MIRIPVPIHFNAVNSLADAATTALSPHIDAFTAAAPPRA
jgi:hypothetical protein